jgi:hypothetical protein
MEMQTLTIKTCDELSAELAHCTGTENHWCLPHQGEADKPATRYTDGVRMMAKLIGAYWLLEFIEETQRTEEGIEEQDFQVWRIISTGETVSIIVDDGYEPPRFTLETNRVKRFPIGEFKIYCVDNVILLPSEY